MLKVKPGVSVDGLHPVMYGVVLPICVEAYRQFGYDFVFTEGKPPTDVGHKPGSRHYDTPGRAIDGRTKNVARVHVQKLVDNIRDALGRDFDVILEALGEEREHLHVEFDPK